MENNLEEKLGAILNDPNMMQQIQAMARALGQSTPQQQEQPAAKQEPQKPQLPDLSGLPALSALAGGAGIDANEKALLNALSPYLSRDRVSRLENAMRAAKMARLASAFLGNGGLQMLAGR